MKNRTVRLVVLTAMSALLAFPTAASAGPICADAIHHVEEDVVEPIPGVGPTLAHEMHEVEEAACPFLP